MRFRRHNALFTDFTQDYDTGHNAHENIQAKLGGFLFAAKATARAGIVLPLSR